MYSTQIAVRCTLGIRGESMMQDLVKGFWYAHKSLDAHERSVEPDGFFSAAIGTMRLSNRILVFVGW